MNTEALISFYINEGASKLTEYAESTMNKKKNKKYSAGEDSIAY
jgi:hypothetical protein